MTPLVMITGITVGLLSALVLVFFVIAPPAPRVARDRRLAPGVEHVSALTTATRRTTSAIDSVFSRRRGRVFGAEELELAGIKTSPSQFVIVIASCASVAALLGVILGLLNGTSILLAVLFAALTPVVAKLTVNMRTSKRREQFADQIDDTLQLLAGSLRAGHGLSIGVSAVASESESPMNEELARAVNESRLGRPLADSLATIAARMRSKDFEWVAQAVAINAEAGGNLAEVLDQVGKTIRDRNQIRRQVRALSAEGRLSGIILIVLPLALFAFFVIIRPDYMAAFFQNILGIIALVVAALLMVLGSIWVALVVRVRF